MNKIFIFFIVLPLYIYSQNGSNDETFNTEGSGFNETVRCIVLQDDNKIIVGGTFNSYNSIPTKKLMRLTENGQIDETFLPQNFPTEDWVHVNDVKVQNDGKILVAGQFGNIKLKRYLSNGDIDNDFQEYTGIPQISVSGILQYNDKILIHGNFFNSAPNNKRYIAQLESNGTIDENFTFDYSTLHNDQVDNVSKLLRQDDGKIIVIGIDRVIRINPDGSIDGSFPTIHFSHSEGNPAGGYLLLCGFIQSDGKILIGGRFTHVNNIPKQNIVRLNIDGTIDSSFNSSFTGEYSEIRSVINTNNNQLLISGKFETYNGHETNGLVKINTENEIDYSFAIGDGVNNGTIYSSTLQNEKIIIAGNFGTFNFQQRGNIARIETEDLNTNETDYQSDINIYPTIVTNQLTVKSTYNYLERIEIFNFIGKLIFSIKVNSKETNINTSDFVKGIYFLKVGKNTIKFIKK